MVFGALIRIGSIPIYIQPLKMIFRDKKINKNIYKDKRQLVSMATKKKAVKKVCPNCGKGYGMNTRKDGTVRCRLCGYEVKS